MKKLDPVFKKKWVDKLREMSDKKCEGTLYNGEKFCALGVAYLVAYGKDTLYEIENTSIIQERHTCVPACLHGNSSSDSITTRIMNMNDGGTDPNGSRIDIHNFNQIADWIEKEVPDDY